MTFLGNLTLRSTAGFMFLPPTNLKLATNEKTWIEKLVRKALPAFRKMRYATSAYERGTPTPTYNPGVKTLEYPHERRRLVFPSILQLIRT